jgi:hypothetical protein
MLRFREEKAENLISEPILYIPVSIGLRGPVPLL